MLFRPRSLVLSAAALASGTLLFTGCGSKVSKKEEGAAPSLAARYFQQETGRPGGTLRISTATDTINLDPHAVSAAYVEWLGRLLFDNLVYLDEQGVPQPWLATSWTISPDRKTYTFHLRDGVTFSDGSKFNAEAVRLNLEHMRDPATRSPLAGRYIAPYVDGKVIDDLTFQANLSEPYSPFLDVLAQTWLAMLSPKAILEHPKDLTLHPVGSGPFVLDHYTPQQGISFKRRADYHWAPPFLRHEGPAYLDRIEIEFVPEALVRYTSLVSGQYDFTFEAPPQYAAAIEKDPGLALENRFRQGVPYRAINFNTERKPFDDVRVRKAFALAVDRAGVARISGFGYYQPTASFLAPNTRFYDPAFEDVLRTNLSEANRLFDEAGWTGRDAEGYRTRNGERLSAEVAVTETATPSPVIVAIQSDVKKAGFDLRITEVPAPQLLERRTSGNYQALGAGVWHTNTPDALFINYHSQEIIHGPVLGQNSSRLRDAVLDDLVWRARRSGDPEELKSLYSQAQKRLVDLVPGVPVFQNHFISARKSYVRGVLVDTSHNTPVLTAAWLDR